MRQLFLIAFAATFAIAQSPPAAPAAEPAAEPVKFAIVHVEASTPQIVRIRYLDEGTREVVLPPSIANPPSPEKSGIENDQRQIIHITNLDDGAREIVVPPSP